MKRHPDGSIGDYESNKAGTVRNTREFYSFNKWVVSQAAIEFKFMLSLQSSNLMLSERKDTSNHSLGFSLQGNRRLRGGRLSITECVLW